MIIENRNMYQCLAVVGPFMCELELRTNSMDELVVTTDELHGHGFTFGHMKYYTNLFEC